MPAATGAFDMAAMVVLAVAVAVAALALVVVAGTVVWQALDDLRAGTVAARQRLAPLQQELLAEQATLQLELDALQRGARRRGHDA